MAGKLFILSKIDAVVSKDAAIKPSNKHEVRFLENVKSHVRRVVLYDDPSLKSLVNAIVPLEELIDNSLKRKEVLREKLTVEELKHIDSRGLLLYELLLWFKNSFFSWFDVPQCDRCSNSKMTFVAYDAPTSDELYSEASRVESYVCISCQSKSRFPRYNDPFKLLETRKGRCGEWANCFCAILRALDYDVRFVLDWTDHVWAEVYSDVEERWIHCDPCEASMDSPLTYEHGWNKKLIYCVAFSSEEVQDVTWRYTTHFEDIGERRKQQCRETWINALVLKVSDILQESLSKEKKDKLRERRVKELSQFLWCPNQVRTPKESELVGRQSGSVLWRLQRGEIGSVAEAIKTVDYKFEIKPGANTVSYNCAEDVYKFGNNVIKGWSSGVHSYRNVFRKVENDWKMCYLSRCESVNPGEGFVAWDIDVSVASWSRIDIIFLCQTYQTGSVELSITAFPEKKEVKLRNNEMNTIKRSFFEENCARLSLKATLRGGNSSVGWQHAQLFRQSLLDKVTTSLSVLVELN